VVKKILFEERSQSKGVMMWAQYILLAMLLIWFGYEYMRYIERGYQGFRIVMYSFAMLLFWLWLYGSVYTIQIEKNEIRVIRNFFIWERVFVVRRAEIVSICERFVKSDCRKIGIRRFMHQYTLADDRPRRVIIFRRNSVSKSTALIFCGSHQMLEVLKKYYQHEIILAEE
jgi:hypothetical protein